MTTHFRILFMAAIAMSLVGPLSISTAKAGNLEEIIDLVRSNEQLYENMEVTLNLAYEANLDEIHGALPLPGGQKVVPFKSYRDKISHVRQNGMFRLAVERAYTKINDQKKDGDDAPAFVDANYLRIRSYDGEKTRLLNNNNFGNIIHHKDEKDDTRIIPHTLLMRMSLYKTYLSTLLGGQIALETANEFDLGTKQITCEYIGNETVNKEPSAIVHVTESLKDGTKVVWKLCLATEKNYIAHSMECRELKFSEKTPTAVGKVTEWKELQPGIWYPMTAEIVSYDKKQLKEHGRKDQRWKLVMTTDNVSLEPNHDKEFFAEVAFPEGVSMYEIDNDRVGPGGGGDQVVKSYVKGSPADPAIAEIAATKKFWNTTTLVAFNALIAAAVVVALRMMSKRYRRLAHR